MIRVIGSHAANRLNQDPVPPRIVARPGQPLRSASSTMAGHPWSAADQANSRASSSLASVSSNRLASSTSCASATMYGCGFAPRASRSRFTAVVLVTPGVAERPAGGIDIRVRVGAAVEQQFGDVALPGQGCIPQRRAPAWRGLLQFVEHDSLVHIGSEVEQEPNDFDVPVIDGEA